ncbi:MAG: NigD-like protein [Paludibacter sp.]
MKTITKLFLFSAILPLFVACDMHEDIDYSESQVDIATVQNPYKETNFFFRLDNKKLMYVQDCNFEGYIPKDGQRIVADYTLLSDKSSTHLYDYDVKLNDVYTVLTKGIFNVTKATQDSIGNDSIKIDQMWIGSDYLNVEFNYPGYNKTHYINLVNDTSKVFTDGKIHLYFRHNSNADAPVNLLNGIASFSLKSLQAGTTSTSLNLVIHVNVPYQAAEKTYDLTYDFTSTVLLAPAKFPKLVPHAYY